MNAKTLVRGHPLIAYFILAYAIPWLGSMAVVGPKFVRGEPTLFADSMIVLLLMLAGPSVAGITMTAIVDGKAGLRDPSPRCANGGCLPAGTLHCSFRPCSS